MSLTIDPTVAKPDFYTNALGAKAALDYYGVAVIPNLLSPEEIEDFRQGMWDTLEQLTSTTETPVNRNDTTTWHGYKQIASLHSMLIQHFGIGHANVVWQLRQNPKVVTVFQQLFGLTNPEDLLVSFDGMAIHLPHELVNPNAGYFRKTWYHCDQSYRRNEDECYQSWVTAYDVNEGDATLSTLLYSHHFHQEFAQTFSMNNRDEGNKEFYVLQEAEQQWYINKGCVPYNLVVPAGSMVLWNSKTIHCGKEPDKVRPQWNIRTVVYICMTPRAKATEANLKKKQDCFTNGRMTTHNPHRVRMFSKTPRTYGAKLPTTAALPPPTMSPLGFKLAGF